jgi:hypothetical protein
LNPLLDELLRAFPLVPLDAKGAFHWYADAEFCERAIHNKTWDQVDLRLIGGRDDALAFLRPERFIQWLPAYLNQLVVVRPESSPIWGGLMSRLTAPDPAIVKDRKRRKFEELGNSLTPAQRQAVARTLQLAIERYPNWGEQPRLALDRYWSAFAETSTVTQDPLLSDLRAAFPQSSSRTSSSMTTGGIASYTTIGARSRGRRGSRSIRCSSFIMPRRSSTWASARYVRCFRCTYI